MVGLGGLPPPSRGDTPAVPGAQVRSSAVQTSSGFVEGVFGSSYVTLYIFFSKSRRLFFTGGDEKYRTHARVRQAFGKVSRTKETTQDGSSDLWK